MKTDKRKTSADKLLRKAADFQSFAPPQDALSELIEKYKPSISRPGTKDSAQVYGEIQSMPSVESPAADPEDSSANVPRPDFKAFLALAEERKKQQAQQSS